MAVRSRLIDGGPANAILSWIVLAVLLAVASGHAAAGDLLWAGHAVSVVGIALIPPLVTRRASQIVTWEVLAIAAGPAVAWSVGFQVGPVAYVAVAALALVVAVELDAFTGVELSPRFAVGFVVIVTMAVAGLWTIARYASDQYAGTTFLASEQALMWDLVGATAVGLAAGVVFELYVRRVSPGHRVMTLPGEEPP